MKGEEAEYVIPLRALFTQPKKKRLRKAMKIIRDFAFKHTKIEAVSVSGEVNEALLRRSLHMPRRIHAVLVKDGERVVVFLKEGKELGEFKKKKEEEEKEKKKKKSEKKEEKEKTPEEKEAEMEKEKKKEEKREKEKASEKADIKRKTGTR